MKRILTLPSVLLMPDAASGGGGNRIAELEAEVESLKRELEDTRSGLGGIPTELRALVKEKRAAGLDLKSALEAAKAQIQWDKTQKDEAAKAEKAKTDAK